MIALVAPRITVVIAIAAAVTARADSSKEMAQRHYQHAMLLVEQAEFRDAIRDFKHAYEVHPDPNVLHDIGQAYRDLARSQLDDAQAGIDSRTEAIRHFRLYLAALPRTRERARVEALIATLEIEREALVAREEQRLADESVKRAEKEEQERLRRENAELRRALVEKEAQQRYQRKWTWRGVAVIGAGLALVCGGTLMVDRAEAMATDRNNAMEYLPPAVRVINGFGGALLGLGLGIVVAGVVVLRLFDASGTNAWIAPAPGGASMGIRF